MHIRNKLYPYPILAEVYKNYDYVDSHFDIVVDCEIKKDKLILKFQPVLNNDDLQFLIDSGKASFVAHLESTITSYRKLIKVPNEGCEIEVFADDVEGEISVCSFIVANCDIPNYKNKQFNQVYEDFSFDIEKGNVLAIGKENGFSFEKEQGEYSKVSSIFVVTPIKDEKETEMKIDINNDRINIQLPLKAYAQFVKSKLNEAYSPIVHSMLIVPALMKCFEELKIKKFYNEFWEISSRRWFKVLQKALKKYDIELNEDSADLIDSFECTQIIFDNTINRGLMNLFSLDLKVEGD